ncbi:Protein phosphatase 2A regulatory B subunit family protein [Prunus dulcis]|uniref:Protein phosphatase 2A regulatory B subunit family protein n=1 Tax=Prunus dulcis TaxID=3755 RepID=A0A5H2XQA9_PRUDU|nr:Protein phosphatase 2A regulatory B subunit family protein [Prunus dulcis]
MFKKIIKGNKKPSKSDSHDPSSYRYGPSGTRNSGAAANVVVNHVSRAGPAASAPNLGGAPGITALPPSGTIEPLSFFRDAPFSERQTLFLHKLQVCCFQFDFSDTLKTPREKEIRRQTLLELVDFIQSGSGKITETYQGCQALY